jgi:hypothetical protein
MFASNENCTPLQLANGSFRTKNYIANVPNLQYQKKKNPVLSASTSVFTSPKGSLETRTKLLK